MTPSRELRLLCDGADVGVVAVAASFGARLRGLLGESPVRRCLLLEPCSSIHTLGMSEALDVAFCTADLEVLDVRTVPPWRPWVAVPGTRSVLEAAAGALSMMGVRPGLRLAVALDGRVLPDRRARRDAARGLRRVGGGPEPR